MTRGVEIQTRVVEEPAPVALWVRLVQLLPATAFLATFGVFFVDKNREARTVLTSGRGLVAVAVIVVGYVLLSVGARRVLRRAWLAPVVLAVAVLGLAAWIVRPYYVDETANRTIVTEVVRDRSEASPASGDPATAPERSVGPAVPPASPVRISTGTISGIDHDAAGTVSLIRTHDGLVLRFENFDIEGSPDPQLYLAEGSGVREPGGVHFGRMPGNRGELLDIAVPSGTDAGPGWTVLVWCGRFSVPIANATQSAI